MMRNCVSSLMVTLEISICLEFLALDGFNTRAVSDLSAYLLSRVSTTQNIDVV